MDRHTDPSIDKQGRKTWQIRSRWSWRGCLWSSADFRTWYRGAQYQWNGNRRSHRKCPWKAVSPARSSAHHGAWCKSANHLHVKRVFIQLIDVFVYRLFSFVCLVVCLLLFCLFIKNYKSTTMIRWVTVASNVPRGTFFLFDGVCFTFFLVCSFVVVVSSSNFCSFFIFFHFCVSS